MAHLATSDAAGTPHVVPVCFALDGETVFVAIDEKPKRTDRPIKRLRNIATNPQVALVADHYEEDWQRLGWVMVRGPAEILTGGREYARAHELVRVRYPQLRGMRLDGLPVIAVRIAAVARWGHLEAPDARSS